MPPIKMGSDAMAVRCKGPLRLLFFVHLKSDFLGF